MDSFSISKLIVSLVWGFSLLGLGLVYGATVKVKPESRLDTEALKSAALSAGAVFLGSSIILAFS